MSSIWLRVDGYAATEIAPHSPLTWETWADGGCGSASWTFDLTPRSQHQALRPGVLVEIMCGFVRLWVGLMADPDRTSWECHAFGLASSAKNFLALGGNGLPTREIGSAAAQAIARGWRGNNSRNVSSTVSGTSAEPITLAELLDQHALATGWRWGVDPDGALYLRADPTLPDWLAAPDTTAFGRTEEGTATILYARYVDSTTLVNETAIRGSNGVEAIVDLTSRGKMSLTDAHAILDAALKRDYAQVHWTNGVTLNSSQIQTAGGTDAYLPTVRAGQMMRAHGLNYAAQVQAPWVDVVIGKTRYTEGEDSIYVEPVNTAPRNFADIIAAA